MVYHYKCLILYMLSGSFLFLFNPWLRIVWDLSFVQLFDDRFQLSFVRSSKCLEWLLSIEKNESRNTADLKCRGSILIVVNIYFTETNTLIFLRQFLVYWFNSPTRSTWVNTRITRMGLWYGRASPTPKILSQF